MKTLAIMTALLFGGTVFAQDLAESQVPSVVLNTFKKEFPKASDVEWEKQGETYNVDFEIGFFTDYEAWFDGNGKMIKHSEEISEGDLPQTVKNTIKTQYADYKIDDAEKWTTNGQETFLVEIEKGNEEKHLEFDGAGKILNTK
jgi:hypothetical protein